LSYLGKRKPREVSEGSIRDQFIKHFGKPIEEFDSFKRASEGYTKGNYSAFRRVLPYYFLFLDQTPDQVIECRKRDLVSEDVTDNEQYERRTAAYLKGMLADGLAGRTVSTHLGRIQGFYKNNARRLRLNMGHLKIPKGRKRRKYSPSNEEVRLLFSKADCARDKLIVALMYQNGPTPIDVSALCCGDYPVEPWVYFERSRSKTGEVWHSVSMPDVCECLKAYLNVRGNYKPTDPLFFSREGFLDAGGISQVVHGLIGSIPELKAISGLKPTSLRDAFEDALVDAEIYHKVKEALMAHSSGIEQEYGGHNKMVSHLVAAMKKVYPLLCLNDLNRVSGSVAGFSPEELEKLKAVLSRYDEVMTIADLVKNGKLMHVDDPELIKRLRDEGKIK
jgi:site-specific recombinase XerD